MKKLSKICLTTLILAGFVTANADACSRITFATKSGNVVTGRTMDWVENDRAQLRVFKRNEFHKSRSSQPIEWTSKYGVVAVTTDTNGIPFINSGVNEKSLAADFLWLSATNYGSLKKDEKALCVGEQVQYILENFATVDEVVNFVKNSNVKVETTKNDIISGVPLTLHYIVTDKKGNNVIVEYIDGKAQIYQQKGNMVMTNDPAYDKMLAIKDYYTELGIKSAMPGSALSQSRFLYLTAWLNEFTDKKLTNYMEKTQNFDEQAVMSVLSLMRGVSTPLGIVFDLQKEPNNTSTIWRTMADLKNKDKEIEELNNKLMIWF